MNGYRAYVSPANTAVIDALVNYLKNGGILIMLDEYNNSGIISGDHMTVQILRKLFPAQASLIKIESLLGGLGNFYKMDASINDDITNGPFGDMRGKLWGDDCYTTTIPTVVYGTAISGIPANEVVVYSRGLEPLTLTGRASMFRLKNYNLFYVSDGGFLSNDNGHIGGDYLLSSSSFPFAIDSNYRPIPRTGWNDLIILEGNKVYNSQIFGNIMYWAIKNSRVNKR